MLLRRLILGKQRRQRGRPGHRTEYRAHVFDPARWILLNFPSVDMGTLSKTVGFSLYPSNWVAAHTIAVNALGDLLTVPLKNDLKVGAADNSPAIQSQTATVTVEVRSKL